MDKIKFYKIKFYKTRVYGKVVAYFAEKSHEEAFYKLTGRKTLKPADITILNQLTGVEFEEIMESAIGRKD
jgi:hypothetical protein